jgi:hypothetical protein
MIGAVTRTPVGAGSKPVQTAYRPYAPFGITIGLTFAGSFPLA